ncbi:MAG: hypothetical protein ACE5FU_07165 [Nitrospinota bacterium]
MFKWVRRKSRLAELAARVSSLEGRVEALEGEVDRGMKHLGNYEKRTDEELLLMKNQVTDLLTSTDALISTQENNEGLKRAKQLKRRLKNNLTRINSSIKKG